jgi:hypothetical protein
VRHAFAGADKDKAGEKKRDRRESWRQGVGALQRLQELALEECAWESGDADSLLKPLALLTGLRHLELSQKHYFTLQQHQLHGDADEMGAEQAQRGHLASTAAAAVHAVLGIVAAAEPPEEPPVAFRQRQQCLPRDAHAGLSSGSAGNIPSLEWLRLAGLSLDEGDLERICCALASAPRLRSLDLTGNLSTPNENDLLPMLQCCHHLSQLLLCPWPDDSRAPIRSSYAPSSLHIGNIDSRR